MEGFRSPRQVVLDAATKLKVTSEDGKISVSFKVTHVEHVDLEGLIRLTQGDSARVTITSPQSELPIKDHPEDDCVHDVDKGVCVTCGLFPVWPIEDGEAAENQALADPEGTAQVGDALTDESLFTMDHEVGSHQGKLTHGCPLCEAEAEADAGTSA